MKFCTLNQNIMNFFKMLSICTLSICTALALKAQTTRIGSGNDLYFAGTSANQHVDLDTVARLFATSDFTIEFWEHLDSASTASSDIPFICNKDWASGANKGFVISKMSDATPSVWVNFTTASGSRFDLKNVPCPTLLTEWTHIAVSFNRNSSSPKIIVYINGIASDSGSLTAAHSPTTSIVGSQHTRLAQDGTGAYSWGYKYKGFMDEVRIWNTVRTKDDIRKYMCRKLTGGETNLVAYYDFNMASGTSLPNLVAGGENGLLKNMSGSTEWQTSGAAIGDTSIYIYPTSWTGTNLQLTSATNGKLKVSGVSGPMGGVQVYMVDTAPNTYNGINNAGGNSTYYGVFAAKKPLGIYATTPVSYQVDYDYSAYTYAASNSSNIKLYNRYANDYGTWADLSAANNTTSKIFTDTGLSTKRELIIGDFNAVTCSDPVNPYSDSASATFVRVKWTSAGSLWQVQYGYQGFQLGSGTINTISSSPVANISGLSNGVFYDVYVRKICGAGDTSEWTGPLTVYPGYNCPVVSGIRIIQLGHDSVKIVWTGHSSSVYSLEWGPTGFTPGTGIPVNNITTSYYVLHGLAIGQQLDVYVKDSCIGLSTSGWAGPITFVDSGHTVGIATPVNQTGHVAVYPNPANASIHIDFQENEVMTVQVYNTQGILVKSVSDIAAPYTMQVDDLAIGIYLLQCRSNHIAATYRINIER